MLQRLGKVERVNSWCLGSVVQVERVNSLYPGRASMAPLLDLLITLLHWGEEGWRGVLQRREELYIYALHALQVRRAQHAQHGVGQTRSQVQMGAAATPLLPCKL